MTRTFGPMHNQKPHFRYGELLIGSNSAQRSSINGVHPIALGPLVLVIDCSRFLLDIGVGPSQKGFWCEPGRRSQRWFEPIVRQGDLHLVGS